MLSVFKKNIYRHQTSHLQHPKIAGAIQYPPRTALGAEEREQVQYAVQIRTPESVSCFLAWELQVQSSSLAGKRGSASTALQTDIVGQYPVINRRSVTPYAHPQTSLARCR